MGVARRVLLAIGLLILLTLLLGQYAPAQQCPKEIRAYTLIPPGWPCPIGTPFCSTSYGSCYYPHWLASGTPCACQAANGAWVSGIVSAGIGPAQQGSPQRAPR